MWRKEGRRVKGGGKSFYHQHGVKVPQKAPEVVFSFQVEVWGHQLVGAGHRSFEEMPVGNNASSLCFSKWGLKDFKDVASRQSFQRRVHVMYEVFIKSDSCKACRPPTADH